MNILITGATGFVGRHLVPTLIPKNRIVLLVRDIEKAKLLYGDDVEYVETVNIGKVKDYNPDITIHLAAFLTSHNDKDSMERLLQSNIIFGTRLLDSLKNCKSLRLFINFGTFAEYRYGPMRVNNAYLYSATKTAFKQILAYYADLSCYKHINLNPYTIYGGEDSQKKAIDFIKDSFDAIEPVKMSGGEQILDFIHVDDVVSCIKYIVSNSQRFIEEPTSEYHLGSGKGTSLRELAQMLEKKYKRNCHIAWGALPYRERDVMYAVAPIGELLNMGWRPIKRLEDSI